MTYYAPADRRQKFRTNQFSIEQYFGKYAKRAAPFGIAPLITDRLRSGQAAVTAASLILLAILAMVALLAPVAS